jgi:cellulose/xylan binding protein with CBM9 domain
VFVVPLADFSVEDPWEIPGVCATAALRLATDGGSPRLATSVAAYFDNEQLTVVFSAIDDDVVATYLEHDAPLYEEDVVEIFLAPERLTRYFEIEVNPLGTTFDAIIDSPDGVRSTMRTDLAWTCNGLFAAIRRLNEVVDTVIRIPFASLGRTAPADGETWRANFYRIDRSASRDAEFSAWQPALRRPADFHVPAAFGEIRFQR